MELIDDEIIAWEDIKSQYQDEWVVIANPVFDGMKLLKGVVLAHHPDKRVASIEGGERRSPAKTGEARSSAERPHLRRNRAIRQQHGQTEDHASARYSD